MPEIVTVVLVLTVVAVLCTVLLTKIRQRLNERQDDVLSSEATYAIGDTLYVSSEGYAFMCIDNNTLINLEP